MKEIKYYVMPKNKIGQRQVICETHGKPGNMQDVDTVILPNQKCIFVFSKNKEYPAEKVALAIAAGQIKINDIKK